MLDKYSNNFPEYTDHSIEHVKTVLEYADRMLTKEELNNLNPDEIYILLCACLTHDVGMCIPSSKIKRNYEEEFQKASKNNPKLTFNDFIRDKHHKLSHDFVLKEWETLKIENSQYAEAIALVALGHRKTNLLDSHIYDRDSFVNHSKVRLPYLACITRIADECDITNRRTPDLILKYYYPDNQKSQQEFEKHRHTLFVNFDYNRVIVNAECTTREVYNALIELCNKIQQTIDYCQKVVRERQYTLTVNTVNKDKIKTIGFDPKEIGFTFDVDNVFRNLVGGKLYSDKYIAIREALQNAIDTCNFRKEISPNYDPKIIMILDDEYLTIIDNGFGMDEFIVKNYFGRLAKSYYQKVEVKERYDAIAQFGIGVFSYFMICDYFQVKTRLEGSEESKALNFICYNSPDEYFYFKDDVSNINVGTEIKFHLNDEVKGELGLNYLRDLVKYYIRFVGIPILIHEGDHKITISQEDYGVNIKEDVRRSLKSMYRMLNLEFFSVALDTEDYRGECGILIQKNVSNQDNFESLEDKFESKFSFNIAICYKGIFLKDMQSDLLSNLIGKINIKTFQDINLERTAFEQTKFINNIITHFEFELINKAFQLFRELPNPSRYFVQTQFILEHLNEEKSLPALPDMNEYYFLKEEIIYCTIRNGNILYIPWYELMADLKYLIIINYSGTNLYEFKFYISKLFKISFDDLLFKPQMSLKIIEALNIKDIAKSYFKSRYKILLENRYSLFKQLEKYFLDAKFETIVFSNKMFSFYIVKIDKHVEEIDYIHVLDKQYPCLEFDENHICTLINTIIFNKNSPIIDYYLKHKRKIEKDKVLSELFEVLFTDLIDFANVISFFKSTMEIVLHKLDGIFKNWVDRIKSGGDLMKNPMMTQQMKILEELFPPDLIDTIKSLSNPYASMSDEEINIFVKNQADIMMSYYVWNEDFTLRLIDYLKDLGMIELFVAGEEDEENVLTIPHFIFIEIQDVLRELNLYLKTKFTLSKDDFPPWLVEMSVDSSILPTIKKLYSLSKS